MAPEGRASLRKLAAARNFSFGAAVNNRALTDANRWRLYRRNLTNNFNMATLENAHKALYLWLDESGDIDWSKDGPFVADDLVNWCTGWHFRMKFHCMIWGEVQGIPKCLEEKVRQMKDDGASQEEIRDFLSPRIQRYIQNIVQHYAGEIQIYDVVNEWVVNDPNEPKGNWWRENFGEDLPQEAFCWAAQAAGDENVTLIYNDYSIEDANERKSQDAFDLIMSIKAELEKRKLLKDNIRLGVGFQSHFGDVALTPEFLNEHVKPQFDKFREAGIDIYISEFDTAGPGVQAPGVQGWYYRNYLEFCLKYGVTAFQMWDFWDGATWGEPPFLGGLFDKGWGLKPAYWGFYEAIKEGI